MAKAVRFYETGGPEVLTWEAVEVGDPGPGEVRIRHEAVGMNFADTYFRTGLYPAPLPAGMGVEAAGVVEAVGAGVEDFAPGDRVTYTGSPLGAYSTERVMPAEHLDRNGHGYVSLRVKGADWASTFELTVKKAYKLKKS